MELAGLCDPNNDTGDVICCRSAIQLIYASQTPGFFLVMQSNISQMPRQHYIVTLSKRTPFWLKVSNHRFTTECIVLDLAFGSPQFGRSCFLTYESALPR